MKPRRFVIPDIHGCARTFRRLLQEVIVVRRTDTVYLLGDTIDRGPASKEVIDAITSLKAQGYGIHPLRGNHEEMFLKACRDRNHFYMWMQYGGRETLNSFAVEDPCEVPLSYRQFLGSFPYFIELEEFILVHGGLNFKIPDPLLDWDAMLWSRDNEVVKELIGGRRVICGHTPVKQDEIRLSLATDHIWLDNGCVYKGEAGLGALAALELNSMSLLFQENIDM